MPSEEPLFSRAQLLGGLPARRASTVLFAIEARTAHLVARSRHAMAFYETERTSAQRERVFLQALAGARELPLQPTIQDLERFAPRWADVAPREPDLRGAIARLLGRKYRFTEQQVPRLRDTLGLDEDATGAAFERQHSEPIDSIYADGTSFRDRLRWARSNTARRLEELPPFWSAFALTLTEMVGAAILALPIALAGMGAWAGLILLVVAGALNVLTIGGLVEAIARNGSMRYGSAYFGRLAGALLARRGSSAITVALFALNVVTLLTYLIAFASPLANATHVSAYVWVGLLFAVDLFYLRRDLSATVASAIMIAVVNVLLIVLISAVALGHINMDRLGLGQMPFVGSGGVELAAVGLAFGVLMMAFFGHTSCALVARLILEREPSGKALVRGSTAAAATVICLYGLALVSFFGAVPRSELVGNAGTILEPLADRAGSAITVFGTIYILLAVGLASIYVSLGMSNQIREWLPASIRGTRASLLAVVPAAIVFVTVELLLLFDRASFSAPLALIGTLVVPLLGGVFPMLLLAASRHRGERAPSAWVRVLRGPISMGVVAAGFVLGLTLQGIFIWERPLERIATAVMIVVIGVMWWAARQRGAFKPLAVVELRQEAGDNAAVAVMVDGRAQPVDVQLTTARGEHDAVGSERFSELKAASFRLPAVAARELKVWVHGLTAEGDSMGIAAKIVLGSDGAEREIDAPTGAAVVPIDGPLHVRILLG